MKANELMLFDLIRRKKDGKSMTVVELRYAETIAAITPDDVYYGDMEDYHESEIEPIPLTPEILEKNFKEYLPGINLMYQLKGPYFAMNEEGNQWVFGLVKEDGEKSCRYPLVKITYVHELQHAIRLCGIFLDIKL